MIINSEIKDISNTDIRANSIKFDITSSGKLVRSTTIPSFSGISKLSDRALLYKYVGSRISGNLDLSGITTVNQSGLNSAFGQCTKLTSVDLSGITTVYQSGLSNAFHDCINLKEIDLSNITTAPNGATNAFTSAFTGCTGLTSVKLWNNTIALSNNAYYCSYMFNNCINLAHVDGGKISVSGTSSGNACAFMFSNTGFTEIDLGQFFTSSVGSNNLRELAYHMFSKCQNLKTVHARGINDIYGTSTFASIFYDCLNLETVYFDDLSSIYGSNNLIYICYCLNPITKPLDIYFNALSYVANSNTFDEMLHNRSNVTVHFPSSLQSSIGNWSSVLNGFGGTNTTVLFDLPATN